MLLILLPVFCCLAASGTTTITNVGGVPHIVVQNTATGVQQSIPLDQLSNLSFTDDRGQPISLPKGTIIVQDSHDTRTPPPQTYQERKFGFYEVD